MTPQVDKQHYEFTRYLGPDRWASYYTQLRETFALSPTSVLEVGPGDGVYGRYIKEHGKIAYRSLDIDPELRPDIIGSVTKIPLPDNAVDCVVAFEILEHIPFEEFDGALHEIARVSKKNIIVSLPHFGPPLKLLIKLPLLPEIRLSWKIPYRPVHRFNGQHYWELGKRGFPVSRVLMMMERHFVIVRHFVPFENQYHHFFVLTKKYSV